MSACAISLHMSPTRQRGPRWGGGPCRSRCSTPMKHPPAPDEKAKIVQLLRQIADQLKCDAVSWAEFGRRSGVSESKVLRLLGSYNSLVETAGLVPRKFSRVGPPIHSTEDF